MSYLSNNTLMSREFCPPLALHFVWHPLDEENIDSIIKCVRKLFARDKDRPFSRGLNIPLFFHIPENLKKTPLNAPNQEAEKDVVFIFTSVHTFGEEWENYFSKFLTSNNFVVVPIAIDKGGLSHGRIKGCFENIHFLRTNEWFGKEKEQFAVVEILHEIYRHGFCSTNTNKASTGQDCSIKFFISHAKKDTIGRNYAGAIKKFIDNSRMSHFFDATSIAPGFRFDEEIINHIKESTLISIRSDSYSSRYWCQREILCAKEYDSPIISVDCLKEYEDRIFPAGANVPCVHVSPEEELSIHDILRILTAGILETIRHCHANASLKYYQLKNWIDKEAVLITRPPEIRQIIALKKDGKSKICYPEPPLYLEEVEWLNHFDIEYATPLWSKGEENIFNKLRVGISISDTNIKGYAEHQSDQLKRLAQDIARHILARSATLIYGGDLRNKSNFTEFILDEAIALQSRLNTDNIHVENHLAWPLHIGNGGTIICDGEVTSWTAKYCNIMNTVRYAIPDDVSEGLDEEIAITPRTTENKYIWSRCLTDMRLKSIDESHARICAGGKISGYNGKMPGVLEEIIIAMQKKKPIYLLGAYGGIVREVCKSISSKNITEPLTEEWQIINNAGYKELQEKSKIYNHHADYKDIKTELTNFQVAHMAKLAGLNENEYLRLMESPFLDECVHIIIKGLKEITEPSK